MSHTFIVKAGLRYLATLAISIFSYAVMAQPAPSADACGHALSTFQKHLYAHFLAGPDSLREFVFNVRGVQLLDIYQVDAWARNIAEQTCPAGERVAAETGNADAAPSRAPDASPYAVGSMAPAAAGLDGCTTNVLDVMRCPARSERSRAAVVAELRNAQAAGELTAVGELSDAQISSVVPANASVAKTRAAIRQELALARSAHLLQFGER